MALTRTASLAAWPSTQASAGLQSPTPPCALATCLLQSNDLAVFIRAKFDWNNTITTIPAKDTPYTVTSVFKAVQGFYLGESKPLTFPASGSSSHTFKMQTKGDCAASGSTPQPISAVSNARRLRLI